MENFLINVNRNLSMDFSEIPYTHAPFLSFMNLRKRSFDNESSYDSSSGSSSGSVSDESDYDDAGEYGTYYENHYDEYSKEGGDMDNIDDDQNNSYDNDDTDHNISVVADTVGNYHEKGSFDDVVNKDCVRFYNNPVSKKTEISEYFSKWDVGYEKDDWKQEFIDKVWGDQNSSHENSENNVTEREINADADSDDCDDCERENNADAVSDDDDRERENNADVDSDDDAETVKSSSLNKSSFANSPSDTSQEKVCNKGTCVASFPTCTPSYTEKHDELCKDLHGSAALCHCNASKRLKMLEIGNRNMISSLKELANRLNYANENIKLLEEIMYAKDLGFEYILERGFSNEIVKQKTFEGDQPVLEPALE
jgi:hypothetical protein